MYRAFKESKNGSKVANLNFVQR